MCSLYPNGSDHCLPLWDIRPRHSLGLYVTTQHCARCCPDIFVGPDKCRHTAVTASWGNTTGTRCDGFARTTASIQRISCVRTCWARATMELNAWCCGEAATDTMQGRVDAWAVQSSYRRHLRRRWTMANPTTLQDRTLEQARTMVLFVALELSDKK